GTYWQDAWILKGTCSAGARSASAETENSQPAFENFNTEADGLGLFPNPGVSDNTHSITFTFDASPGHVIINLKDMNGSGVFNQHYQNVKNTLQVDMPSLTQGLYIIIISGEKKSWVKKYMIK